MWMRSIRFPPGSHSCWPRAGTQPTSCRPSLTPGRPSSGFSNRWAGAGNLTLPLVASAGPACVVIKASPAAAVYAARHSTGPGNCTGKLPVNKCKCECCSQRVRRCAALLLLLLLLLLPQALIAAHEVMEVRRTLYFAENLGNRNIGGGMRVGAGVSCMEDAAFQLASSLTVLSLGTHCFINPAVSTCQLQCRQWNSVRQPGLTQLTSLQCKQLDVGPRHAGQRGATFFPFVLTSACCVVYVLCAGHHRAVHWHQAGRVSGAVCGRPDSIRLPAHRHQLGAVDG